MRYFIVIIAVLCITSCSFFKKKKQADADVIARVNDDYLYASDITSLTRGLKGQDSLNAIKSYAENWVRKKLLLQKATENIQGEDIGITKKVEDYREALLLYEYEKALVNKKLDTVMKPEELNDWYERLKNDFPLENDVYLLFFIKLKKDAPDKDQARKWIMKPKDEEDLRKLEGYCREFAITYSMDHGMWYEKANVLKNFPLGEGDINVLNSSHSFREFKTDDGLWYIRIAEGLKKGQVSPLQFVREPIVRAIIEKRRVQLVEKVYDKIYKDGLQSKAFEILVQ